MSDQPDSDAVDLEITTPAARKKLLLEAGDVGEEGFMAEKLPECLRKRIKALRKLQHQWATIEHSFYEQLHELEVQYQSKFADIYKRRAVIVTGEVEPTASDCDWSSDEDEDEEDEGVKKEVKKEIKDLETKVGDVSIEKAAEEKIKGIPDFWCQVLKTNSVTGDLVHEHDESILAYLEDIQVKLTNQPAGFYIEFHFASNEYFSEKVLTKTYIYASQLDAKDLVCDGPEVSTCKGCTISWAKGKNPTVKVVQKTQRHKSSKSQRTVTKTVKRESFFNFFDADEKHADDEETVELLQADYDIGTFIKERLIPHAILIFCGEFEDDEDDFEFEDDEMEEEEESEDEDDTKIQRKKRTSKSDKKDGGQKGGDKPEECKQQ